MNYDTIEGWACSTLDRVTLDREIAKFLRTHRDGAGTLLELLSSVPADRTEAEYRATRALAVF
jgi:hypothetical protein